jgi:CYTH domain-containing protein
MNNTEIERKFLVRSDAFIGESTNHFSILQGYLCKDPDKTIRVRIRDTRAFLTIKSSTLRAGIAKFEWEREIDLKDAQELMKLCLPGAISKTRYIIPAPPYQGESRCWEVDVFHDRLDGLVIAEIEIGNEHEPVSLPSWIGAEVTGNPRYYNANL